MAAPRRAGGAPTGLSAGVPPHRRSQERSREWSIPANAPAVGPTWPCVSRPRRRSCGSPRTMSTVCPAAGRSSRRAMRDWCWPTRRHSPGCGAGSRQSQGGWVSGLDRPSASASPGVRIQAGSEPASLRSLHAAQAPARSDVGWWGIAIGPVPGNHRANFKPHRRRATAVGSRPAWPNSGPASTPSCSRCRRWPSASSTGPPWDLHPGERGVGRRHTEKRDEAEHAQHAQRSGAEAGLVTVALRGFGTPARSRPELVHPRGPSAVGWGRLESVLPS
jgi:hypothetical protein